MCDRDAHSRSDRHDRRRRDGHLRAAERPRGPPQRDPAAHVRARGGGSNRKERSALHGRARELGSLRGARRRRGPRGALFAPQHHRAMRAWLRTAAAWLAAAYVAALLATTLLLRFVGEHFWVTSLALYLPRLAFLAPVP